eukprot:78616_1
MPRFYCDYCDVYLTHDSFSGRKQHMRGRRHQDNVRQYYMQFLKRGVLNNMQNILLPGMGSVPTTSQAAARATPGMPSSTIPQPIVPNSSLIGHTMPTAPPPQDLTKTISAPGNGYGPSRVSGGGSSSLSRHNPTH